MLGNTLEFLKRKDISCLTTCRSKGGGVSIDLDAQNVIEAIENTGITLSSTQISACNKLINDLKAFELWVKSKPLYGIMGGTAAAHKFNWKDPRDLDAAFRLQFFGGWTHSANGALPNGTNAYANTFFNPLSNLITNSTHLSFYSRTNGTGFDIGNQNGSNVTSLSTGYIGVAYSDQYNYNTARISQSVANSQGFYIGSRTNGSTHKLYKNGSQIGSTNTGASGTPFSLTLFLGAVNSNGGGSLYSNKQCAFVSIGDGLSDTEALNFYTAVQTFQTTLGRQL